MGSHPDKPIRRTRGAELRRAREAAGYSQDELADRTWSSQRSISNYEQKGVTPPVDVAIRIKRALRLTWQQFEAIFGLGA